MLLLSAWSATTGLLAAGAEVIVELEDKAPFWATVVDTKEDMKKKTEDGNCVYTV
jgi:hypothetical protein